ncbi:MAG: hypothetical protein VXZ60_02710 [Pseudomonadota bacterium]|nr:hypothetical protein [Pseudomonadota bacterium]MEC8518320.1 hypothetical protein [Pseudomonadota bacterium]
MQCDRCGEEDTSKLVTYGLKFSRDAVFCAKCAMIEIPLRQWKRVGNIYPEPKRHKWARLPSPLDD